MSYPLIIFGAGASYDFLKISRYDGELQYKLNQWRAPLTKQVFDPGRFLDIIRKYEDLKPLASTIVNIGDNDSFDFEAYLSDQEVKYPEQSYPQIIALRFYLAELLGKVSYYFFKDINNHSHLIDQINKMAGKAIVVNFNYDTLFEKNLNNIRSSDRVDSYIDGNIKVIKIHGAHNWRYEPQTEVQKQHVYSYFISHGASLQSKYQDRGVDPKIVREFDYENENFNLNVYREHENNGFPGGRFLFYLPTIAIPIASKSNSVCPNSHIEVLNDELSKVDRILLIGWRAQDAYLLKLLKDRLRQKTKICIVSNNEMSARKIAEKFAHISQIDNYVISKREGYTNFMASREYENFFT